MFCSPVCLPVQDIVTKMKMSAYNKAKRYRDFKAKATKLQSLRAKHKKAVQTQDPSEGVVFGGFVPSGHGFNFSQKSPWAWQESSMETDQQLVDVDETESESPRKRKNVGDDTKKSDSPSPWYTRYITEKIQLENSFQARFNRSLVRATAAKNVALLREILEERANDPSNLKCGPVAKLFPGYPSKREKYREELNYALLIACNNNSCEMVEMLLQAGANVSQFNEWYPLVMSAVDTGNLELLQILMKYGSDPNASRYDGAGLHAVARKATWMFGAECCCEKAANYFKMAEVLLEAGADINLKNNSEESTPLHEAVRNGRTEAVQFLLNKGADVNIQDSFKRVPLHWGAAAGNQEIVKLLLEKGADPLAVDKDTKAPWMLSMKYKFDSVAKLLCSFHDVNATDANGRTPLHTACAAGCTMSVEVLLREGANFNAVDIAGDTPLTLSCVGKPRVVEMLLSIPQINIHNKNKEGYAAIHLAVNRLANTTPHNDLDAHDKYSKAAMRVVNLLIAKGADVNTQMPLKDSLVVRHANNQIVFNRLVAAGADVNDVNKDDGNNVLIQAVLRDVDEGNTLKTEQLLKSNVDVRRLSRTLYQGITALRKAIRAHNLDLVKLLVNSGAETSHLLTFLNTTDDGKRTKENLPGSMKTYLDNIPKDNSFTLMDMARSAVLRQLGHRQTSRKISQLMIPKSLQKFLTHEIYVGWKSESLA